MTIWVEAKYVGMLSGRLGRFKRTGKNTWNARCPICGDSEKKASKARFYFYERKGTINVDCKNCGYHGSFRKFLREYDSMMSDEMALEEFTEERELRPSPVVLPKTELPPVTSVAPGLIDLITLPKEHPTRWYVQKRLIPHPPGQLYHVAEFFKWADTVNPGKYPIPKEDEPRLVIPIRDVYEKRVRVVGYQGRKLTEGFGAKYLTLRVDPTAPLVWGRERVNTNRLTLITEGPLDAMMLINALAPVGATNMVGAAQKLKLDRNHTTFIFDNEPRNKAICDQMERAITLGYGIVIWPVAQHCGDVNEMVVDQVMNNNTRLIPALKNVHNQIVLNTYRGVEASLVLGRWRKC